MMSVCDSLRDPSSTASFSGIDYSFQLSRLQPWIRVTFTVTEGLHFSEALPEPLGPHPVFPEARWIFITAATESRLGCLIWEPPPAFIHSSTWVMCGRPGWSMTWFPEILGQQSMPEPVHTSAFLPFLASPFHGRHTSPRLLSVSHPAGRQLALSQPLFPHPAKPFPDDAAGQGTALPCHVASPPPLWEHQEDTMMKSG